MNDNKSAKRYRICTEKGKKLVLLCLLLICSISSFLFSCKKRNFFEDGKIRKLNEKSIRYRNYKINSYRESYITTIHEFISISKDNNKATIIFESPDGNVKKFLCKEDTLYIYVNNKSRILLQQNKYYEIRIKIDSIDNEYKK